MLRAWSRLSMDNMDGDLRDRQSMAGSGNIGRERGSGLVGAGDITNPVNQFQHTFKKGAILFLLGSV